MALGGSSYGGRDELEQWRRKHGVPSPEMDLGNTNNAYRSAIPKQAEDYDTIMQGYKSILEKGAGEGNDLMNRYRSLLQGMGEYTPVSYAESGEQKTAFKDLKNLVDTGGISDAEAGDLRARGVSGIRSVYANMERDMNRQRALSGGYSPSFNATAARMAREGSESIQGAITNVNAKIAEMRQAGKLSAAPNYANLADSKTKGMNTVNLSNAENKLKHTGTQASLLNGMTALNGQNMQPSIDALRGMTSLYGTTPALVETFGGQLANQNQQTNTAKAQKQNYKANVIGGMSGRRIL